MSTKNSDVTGSLGCLAAAWTLLVTGPMWYALLFAILSSVTVPVWAWVLYWSYVPASILGIIIAFFARALSAD